jgi:hypothetical protein
MVLPIETDAATLPLGHVVMSRGVALHCQEDPRRSIELLQFMHRHAAGDWGELTAEDRRANVGAIRHGARVLSAYTWGRNKLWIITEADRSSTCALWPEEY